LKLGKVLKLVQRFLKQNEARHARFQVRACDGKHIVAVVVHELDDSIHPVRVNLQEVGLYFLLVPNPLQQMTS
jgi:hypothetical protein